MNDGMPEREHELDELRAEIERLRALQRSRADAIAGLTHQLKTPLTSLLGYAMILRTREEGLTPEQRRGFVGVIEEQGQKILRLIEDLLQSSRFEDGEASLQRVPVDLVGLARRVADEMGMSRGREISVEGPEDELGLYGDPAAVEHILTNMLDNALKYSPQHAPVRVRIVEGNGEVALSVQDEGKGIPTEELPFVFERFRQASNALGRGSVGLGLHIVKALTEAHGGQVWVESVPGSGATFGITLPRRRAH